MSDEKACISPVKPSQNGPVNHKNLTGRVKFLIDGHLRVPQPPSGFGLAKACKSNLSKAGNLVIDFLPYEDFLQGLPEKNPQLQHGVTNFSQIDLTIHLNIY